MQLLLYADFFSQIIINQLSLLNNVSMFALGMLSEAIVLELGMLSEAIVLERTLWSYAVCVESGGLRKSPAGCKRVRRITKESGWSQKSPVD